MYEIDFLRAGTSNGDAICIRYGNPQPGYYLHVVDGGFKDTAEIMIDHIETNYGKHYFINHMVVSHADNDHACGLLGVLERFEVKVLWMNRPWLFAEQILQHFHGNYTEGAGRQHSREAFVPGRAGRAGEEARNRHSRGLSRRSDRTVHGAGAVTSAIYSTAAGLRQNADVVPRNGGGARGFFADLVEKAKRYADETWDIETLSNNPEPTSASNETCVVQYGVIDGHRTLLTADAGPAALNEAADYAQAKGLLLPPHFVQVPHHGSRRNITPAVLDRLLGGKVRNGQIFGTAVCSVGSNQADYPRGQVKNAFARRVFPVHTTRRGGQRHYAGFEWRPGWRPSTPEAFDNRVER